MVLIKKFNVDFIIPIDLHCELFYDLFLWLFDNNMYLVEYADLNWKIVFVSKLTLVLLMLFKYDWLNLFQVCCDIIAYDNLTMLKYRFGLIYYLLSIVFNIRVSLLTELKGPTPTTQSISLIVKSASWSEREIWDLYGIKFIGHNDLRRILTDYGFKGFALRKNYPLTGYYEVVYNYTEQAVIYIKVSLSQDFRKYYFDNPWLKDELVGVTELTDELIDYLVTL